MNDGNQATSFGNTRVAFSNVESLVGRLGAQFGYTWSQDSDAKGKQQLTTWIRPNIWHEFLGDPITRFSAANEAVPFRSALTGIWGEINIGISYLINPGFTLFANTSYNHYFDGEGYAYDGKIGIRVNW